MLAQRVMHAQLWVLLAQLLFPASLELTALGQSQMPQLVPLAQLALLAQQVLAPLYPALQAMYLL